MGDKQKLTVLFDAEPMARGGKSGVGYYTDGLITALSALGTDKIELVGHHYSKSNDLPMGPNLRYVRSKLLPQKAVNMLRRFGIEFPFELLTKKRGDFNLFPNFIGYPSLFKTPSAVAVHDLTYLDFPEFVSPKNRSDLTRFVPKSLQRASLLVTISGATKQAINSHYPWLKIPIVITPIPPPAPVQDTNQNLLDGLHINKPYLLFVGNLEPRKNLLALIKAYELLPPLAREKYQLVLAGGIGWNNQELVDELAKNNEGIIATGYISDEQKACLYKHASLFVLPSHYEGFGMPILEAMSYGTPVAASDIPVFYEVAGDAAFYFDQDVPQSIADIIAWALEKGDSQKQLMQENLARFNWQNIAGELYEAMLACVPKS